MILLFIWSGISAELLAQQDTIQLSTAVIYADRKWLFASGSYTETLDSTVRMLFSNQMISDWPFSSSVILKDYGPGGIATVSMRGMEARHTSVIWNGIPLNSPSLGLTDLAILPVSPNSEITVFHGSASALYHTSASGSAIMVEEKNHFENNISMNAAFEAGSFNSKKFAAGFQASGLKLYQSFSIKLQDSENDFPFLNTSLAEKPQQKQHHAAENHFILTGQTGWRLTTADELTFSWHYQDSKREIPPLMTQTRSDAELKDSLLNAFLRFRKTIGSDFSIQLKTAILANNQQYHDTISRIFSESKTLSQHYETGATYFFSRLLTTQAGLVYSNTRFDFTDYESDIQTDDYSAFTMLRFEEKKFNASIHFRKMWRANAHSPLLVSTGIEYSFNSTIRLRVKAGSSYQFPTANDLYWKPGGNPHLKPEDCLSMEAGADLNFKMISPFSITVYRNDVNDWIQWVPVAAGYYSPQNVKKVRADGIESAMTVPLSIKKWNIKLTGSYAFSLSLNRSVHQVLAFDILNKQLIYIPEHAASGTFHVSYHGFSILFIYRYNGLRYTTADHTYFLPAYHLLQCALTYQGAFRKFQLEPFFRIHNLTDAAYQSMAWRPMPGRSFNFGMSIAFHPKSSNH